MRSIGNKQYKQYSRISRYSAFPYYYDNQDNKCFYGLTANLATEGVSSVPHVVKRGDTLDSLALYYYNNPTYYWIIADFNRIQDPYEKLVEGRLLKIPTFSNIKFDI